jgi:hypothetical protein
LTLKSISKLAAAGLLFLALCGCHKDQSSVPGVSADAVGCSGSLVQIVAAKNSWARQTGGSSSSSPTWDDLAPFFPHGAPQCPAKGTYTIGTMDELPKCSIAAHNAYFVSQQQQQQQPAP